MTLLGSGHFDHQFYEIDEHALQAVWASLSVTVEDGNIDKLG